MPFEFSPGSKRALTRAIAWAAHHDAPEVLPLHLLLGLIEDADYPPSTLLVAAGAEREQLERAFFSQPLPADAADALPFSGAIHEIFVHARELARSQSTEETIATEHTLLALLDHDEALRSHLEEVGLDFARLRASISPTQPPIVVTGEPLNLLEPPEDIDAARILDACANRSREALRVLEDHCRFVLGDAFLSRELKEMRHELAAIMKNFPERLLVEARDTLGDVGTHLSTPQELERSSLHEVVKANAARLQEALRSLEEFSKIFSADLGQAFERIRYRSYTIERALVLGSHARARLADAKIYVLVTEELCRTSLLGTVAEVLAGGAQIIQLREKKLSDRALLDLARTLRKMTRDAGALLIINDRPDIARLAEADGVHLGQDDMPPREARRIVGPHALLGISTHDIDQVRRAVLEGASYVGVGPTFPSRTKSFTDFAGLDFIRQVTAETTLPAFALGGITPENLPEVLAAGAHRIAISHAICASPDPRLAATKLRQALDLGARRVSEGVPRDDSDA